MRLFVAVWPPPEVVEVLAALERPAVDGVRWTTPSQWHVTLRFLGEVADEAVPDVEGWFRTACATLAPVEARLAEATARFGRGVLHVPVDGLAPWAASVGGDVPGGVARPPAGGPFAGHVTLARARRGRASVAALAGRPLPPGARSWTASSAALVRSRLGPGGSVYTDLARVGAVIDRRS